MYEDLFPAIALIISSIALLLSIVNYYKSFEPALNIDIKTNEGLTSSDNLTKIIFSNTTNNKFSDLSIKCYFYYNNPISEQNLKLNYSDLFPQSIYLGPKDKISINVNFLKKINNKKYIIYDAIEAIKPHITSFDLSEQSSAEIIFKYEYTFLFVKNFYFRQFKWNNSSKSWDTTSINNYYSASI